MDNKILDSKMKEIYEKIKTPYKYGAVVKDKEYLTDSPTVFKFKDKWYMYYIMIHKNITGSGYETHLASSDNLLDWKYEGVVLKRTDNRSNWDSRQIA